MPTGTPLDLTVIPEMLRAIGAVVPGLWLVALVICLSVALSTAGSAQKRKRRVMSVIVVLVALPGFGAIWLWYQFASEFADDRERRAVSLAKSTKAEALFRKRCETAGEHIDRVVSNVRGVVWMRWRPVSREGSNYQFGLYDPYGWDCAEESCIQQLLRSTFLVRNQDMNVPRLPENGYEYVDTIDPRDGRTYRYVAGVFALSKRSPEERKLATRNNNGVDPGEAVFGFGVQRREIKNLSARYGVTWDDISTQEDRDNWIAGGSLSVIDLQTREVIARRVGYMMDRGLGATAGSRDPWAFAAYNSCPTAPKRSETDSRPVPRADEKTAFLFKVLQPIKGEIK